MATQAVQTTSNPATAASKNSEFGTTLTISLNTLANLLGNTHYGPLPEPWVERSGLPVPWKSAGPSPEPWSIAGLTRTLIGSLVSRHEIVAFVSGDEQSNKSMNSLVQQLDDYIDWICGTVPHFPHWPHLNLTLEYWRLFWWHPLPPPPPPNGEPWPIRQIDVIGAVIQFEQAIGLLDGHPLQAHFKKAVERLTGEGLKRFN